jgi:hypothetical protein
MSHFDDLTVEELQSYFSDFHKDYYGFEQGVIILYLNGRTSDVLVKGQWHP